MKFRRGIATTTYNHLKGRIDSESLLEDLGIDAAYRHKKDMIMCHCPDLESNHANGDANPSFGFNESLLAYNCFVCGGGNIIQLVKMMKPELTNEEEILDYLEKFADLNQTNILEQVQALLQPTEEAPPMPDYPLDNLFQYRGIHPYLYERGLTKDVIVEMQVGFDESHFSIVIPHMFMGKLVGIQRRHLLQTEDGYYCDRCSETDKKVSKYKSTPNFPKANTLYGYDQMKEAIKRDDRSTAIVVESPFTVLYLKSLGFHRCCATFGSFSPEQAMLLMGIDKVYFWPDNDAAGLQNALRAAESLLGLVNLDIVPVVDVSKGDAADLKSAEEVVEYLKNAYTATLYIDRVREEGLLKLGDLSAVTDA
jgi:DNA primase